MKTNNNRWDGMNKFDRLMDITTKDRKVDVHCRNCGMENTVRVKAGNNKDWSACVSECWHCNESLRQS